MDRMRRNVALCGLCGPLYLVCAALLRRLVPWQQDVWLRFGQVCAAVLALAIPLCLLSAAGELTWERPQMKSWQGIWAALPLFLVASEAASLVGRRLDGDSVTALPTDHGWALVWLFVLLCVVPAVGEELLLRGAVLRLLCGAGGVWAAIGSALVFALLHASWGQCLAAFVCGLLLGLVAQWAGCLWPCMLLHFCNNLLGFTQMVWPQAQNKVSIGILLIGSVWGTAALWRLWPQLAAPLPKGQGWRALAQNPVYWLGLAALALRVWMAG